MSRYDAQVGACPPGVGCPLPYGGYPYGSPYGAAPYASPYVPAAYPLVAQPFSWDLIGQAVPGPVPAPAPTVTDRVSTFLNNETFGVKNRNLLLGAAALGGIYYGYTAGWFGGRRRAR